MNYNMRNSQDKCLALSVLKSEQVLPLAYLVNTCSLRFCVCCAEFFIDYNFKEIGCIGCLFCYTSTILKIPGISRYIFEEIWVWGTFYDIWEMVKKRNLLPVYRFCIPFCLIWQIKITWTRHRLIALTVCLNIFVFCP